MPQGLLFGPLLFLVLINDLSISCPVHKYVDDRNSVERVVRRDKMSVKISTSDMPYR